MFITGCILAILYKFNLTKGWGEEWYSIVMFCSFILGVIFAIRFCSKSKGVFIFNDCLEIDRYYITTLHWKPNIKINYNDIKNIYNSRKTIDRSSFNAMKGIVAGGDLSYYTEIVLNNGKVFRIPVENQEIFVETLIEKINDYRQNNGLKEIKKG